MALTLADLFASPDHYLHSFADGAAVFVPMDAAAYRASVFLDDRIRPVRAGAMRVPLEMLAGPAPPARPTGWIFHVAHCGSTLLANALDALGPNLMLREPLALRQLAVAEPLDGDLLDVALAMVAKRYDPAAPTLVKANVPVNFIIDAIAARQPDAPAILLHLGLDDYLCAILRSDNHRAWLRGVSDQLATRLGDPAGAGDAVLAARLWLAQSQRFAAALAMMPGARVLDAEAFFADPARSLAAAARHFGMSVSGDSLARIVTGEVFATYSKQPGVAFTNTDRLARRAATRSSLSGEIAEARRWLEQGGHDAAAVEGSLRWRALTPEPI